MSTLNLLRPGQVDDAKSEEARITGQLSDPRAQIQDRGEMIRQLRSVKESLETRTPTPYKAEEIDVAVAREAELRELMVSDGMPTQAEMRKSPPGAVSKHMGWEGRHKGNLLEWKHLRQRIYADANDAEIANFEMFRPAGGAGEMNMDNALIPGSQYFLPAGPVTVATVFDDSDKATLEALDPDLASQLSLMTNEQRAAVHAILNPAPEPKTKAPISDEQAAKNKAWGKMTAEKRAAKKAAKEN